MKFLLPVLLAASLAAVTPAMADHDHGHGGGHGGGHGDGGGRGEGGGRGDGGGGWHGGDGNGRGGGGGRYGGGQGGPGEGRYGGGYPGPEGGPAYVAPRGRGGADYYPGEQDQARRGVRGGWKTMGEVVGQLQRRGGRMLDAGLIQGPDGRPAYRVVWAAPNGRRIDYIIDPQTGAILEGR